MTAQSLPLTPPDCDLRDFPFMPLDVVRLRDSDISALTTGDEFRCAVLLWCASWHQVPAASLPDDDVILARIAGYGRVVEEWRKVRDGALRGWIQCADGRLYHPVVAEKANEAWEGRLEYRRRKEADRLRKAEMRAKRRTVAEQQTEYGNHTDKQRLSGGQAAKIQRTGSENDSDKLRLVGGQAEAIQQIGNENDSDELGLAGGRPEEVQQIESENDSSKLSSSSEQTEEIPQIEAIQRIGDPNDADNPILSNGQHKKVQRTGVGNPSENALIGTVDSGQWTVDSREKDKAAANHKPMPGNGPSPPLVAASRSAEMAILLCRNGAMVPAESRLVIAWTERGVTDEQLLQALDIAQRRRAEVGSQQSINAGFLDAILNGEVLVKSLPKPSRHHGIDQTDFREGVGDDGRF